MAYTVTLALFMFFTACIYWALSLAETDPHNVQDTPAPWVLSLKAALATVALAWFYAIEDKTEPSAIFAAMFVLGSVVGASFRAKDRYRADEVENRLDKWGKGAASALGGVILMKLISVLLAFLTGWLIGSWWFALLLVLGVLLIWSKGLTSLMLVDDPKGPYSDWSSIERNSMLRKLRRQLILGTLGYWVAGGAAGYAIFTEITLDPFNWHGWLGVIVAGMMIALSRG